MVTRLLGVVVLIAVLVHLARVLKPTRFGLVFGVLMVYMPMHFKIPFNALPMVNALTATTVVLLILMPSDRPPLMRHASALRGLILAFCGVSLFGAALASGAAESFGTIVVEFKRWVDPVIFGLLALAITRTEDRKYSIACMMVGYSLVAIQAIREGLSHSMAKRAIGLLGQANETAAFLAMYAPIALALALLLFRGRSRLGLVAIAGFGGAGIMFTQSRAAMIAFGLGLVVALVAAGKRGVAMAVLAVVVLLVGVVPELLPERVTARFEETVLEDAQSGEALEEALEASSAARIMQWKAAVTAMMSNPLGQGFGRFKSVIGGYGGVAGLDAHNFFLLVGVEIGVAGIALAIALFGKMGANAWAMAHGSPEPFRRALGAAACGMVTAAVIVNCFGSRLMQDQPSTYLWVIAAMTARARDALADVLKSAPPGFARRLGQARRVT